MPQLPACCFYLAPPPPSHPGDDAVSLDSKRLNGRFRSRPSYDHPAVSGSPARRITSTRIRRRIISRVTTVDEGPEITCTATTTNHQQSRTHSDDV